jgi:uncharacterized membrane protein YhhN
MFEKKFENCLLLGLMSCFFADIILNYNFVIGAIFFAIGHILYFSSYCFLEKYSKKEILFPFLIFTISAIFLLIFDDRFNYGTDAMKVVCVFYAMIISVMVGKSISNAIELRTKTSILLLVGSVLFFISDVALLLYVIGGANELANTVCLITYFPAQTIIAFAINCENQNPETP